MSGREEGKAGAPAVGNPTLTPTEAARLAVSINYVRACSGCDKPTWWRTHSTGAALCPACCASHPDGYIVNICPPRLRDYLPPYSDELPAGPSGGTP